MINGPENCNCFYCYDKEVDKGKYPCEYYNHHCELCHERKNCTEIDCVEDFKK